MRHKMTNDHVQLSYGGDLHTRSLAATYTEVSAQKAFCSMPQTMVTVLQQARLILLALAGQHNPSTGSIRPLGMSHAVQVG